MKDLKYPDEICTASHEITRDWWNVFLKQGGPELFRELLLEMESGEAIEIKIKGRSNYNRRKNLPENVVIMILMRVAVKTLAVGLAVEQWCNAQEN